MSLSQKNLYWTKVVEDIERKANLNAKKAVIKKYDFSVTLPQNLKKRVAKILPYEFDEYDKNVFIAESAVETPISFGEDDDEDGVEKIKEVNAGDFNESTCSEIERLEHEYVKFDFNMDKALERKAKAKQKRNWCSKYVCKQRKERVKWDSKIYDLERCVWEKTLDEQAAQLMDASAERFTEWINSLGSNRDSDISKEKLKALFSIEGDRKLLSSILTNPKEVKAIAKTVADKWNLPEMAIELKYESYIRDRLKNIPKKINTVAFGRTIPVKDRPWLPSESDAPLTTVYPEELLSLEKLFKGITHLRSTQAVVEFYKARPTLDRPRYLETAGMFKRKAAAQSATEIPLYERLKLKY